MYPGRDATDPASAKIFLLIRHLPLGSICGRQISMLGNRNGAHTQPAFAFLGPPRIDLCPNRLPPVWLDEERKTQGPNRYLSR